ncbi:hypothetical protein ACE106_15125 [Shouchella clausii]|uniref:hypothetical protein n=1 Tax=Shouchella clausii TaxID=79880 RepID=UPI002898AF5B|nr:hypothetical protein [Shouchella clausii]
MSITHELLQAASRLEEAKQTLKEVRDSLDSYPDEHNVKEQVHILSSILDDLSY